MTRFRATAAVAALLLAACADAPAAPDAELISVRLRNELGQSAGRNEVIIERGGSVSQVVRRDGTGAAGRTDVTLPGPGTYLVRVIPRDGYASSPTLQRVVTVEPAQRLVLEFTLYRTGMSELPPPMSPPYPSPFP